MIPVRGPIDYAVEQPGSLPAERGLLQRPRHSNSLRRAGTDAAMPMGVARHGAPQTYRQSCRTPRLP